MYIHEYQAKQILGKYGVPVPNGKVAFTSDEAKIAAQELASEVFVVKAQIHAGGRGKAGGVKLVKTVGEVLDVSRDMLGMTLVTPQTGPEGKVVKRLYVEEGSNIEKEYYVSVVVDRSTDRVTFIASSEGGMEIEEVAETNPEKIITATVDPAAGIQPFHARKIGFGLGIEPSKMKGFSAFIFSLYKAFVETDASQLEINPLVLTKEGNFIALDAKFNFDDNALFRHGWIEDMRDSDEEEPSEREAAQNELSYIKMDGNIGCLVNGAGLAMATMDIIKLKGGEPANFLDVGGGATKERVAKAFSIIMGDHNVEAILVNIFGGIMRCDIIAEGIIAAAKEVSLNVPLVVRLEGTNVDLGKEILSKSGISVISADDLEDAAEKVVRSVQKEAA